MKRCKIFHQIENAIISRKNAKIFLINEKISRKNNAKSSRKVNAKISRKNGNYAKKRKFREKYRIFKNKFKI